MIMSNRSGYKTVALALWCVALLALAGCAGASVNPMLRTSNPVQKPDFILVHDFAVTPAEVTLDKGMLATAMRDSGSRSQTEEEMRVGRLVADKLSQSLVEELRKQGINAFRANSNVEPTSKTVILKGEFVTVDQGNQTTRVWVGFGLGGSELRTVIQALQGGELVAQAETATKSSLKPGMLVSIGTAAAAESGASLAVGAAGAGVSETFLATVEADAGRTAKEVAKKIKDAYVDRGWLPK
jgi:hypothetical protein